jgi:hypothetical protein
VAELKTEVEGGVANDASLLQQRDRERDEAEDHQLEHDLTKDGCKVLVVINVFFNSVDTKLEKNCEGNETYHRCADLFDIQVFSEREDAVRGVMVTLVVHFVVCLMELWLVNRFHRNVHVCRRKNTQCKHLVHFGNSSIDSSTMFLELIQAVVNKSGIIFRGRYNQIEVKAVSPARSEKAVRRLSSSNFYCRFISGRVDYVGKCFAHDYLVL